MAKVGVDNLIISRNGDVLLVQRSKESKKYPLCWGFVGGWMEEGELPTESLTREAKEEIGVETKDHQFIGKVFSNIMPDGVTRIVLPYLAMIPMDSRLKLQTEEVVDAKWFTIDQALNLTLAYDHKDVLRHVFDLGLVDKYIAMDIKTVIGEWEVFLNQVVKNLQSVNIEVSKLELDHVAYRATTKESFDNHCSKLGIAGHKLCRNVVRNRFIDIYQLNKPIEYCGRQINLLELTAPAEGDKFNEGLEHAEFIVHGDLREFIKSYPDLDWNTNAIDREIGADVGIYFDNGANVKFKTMSMSEIVRLEKEKL